MTAQHQKLYWDSDPVKGDPLGRVRYRIVARGKTITQSYYSSSDPDTEEEIRRLVACWNACDGVPTEVLEAQMAGGLPWNVGNQIDKLADLAKAEAERDHARSRFDNAIKLLTGIHALLYPPVTKDANGQSWAFRPKNLDPHEIMQELSDRIRALPDEIDRAQAEAIGTNKEGG